MWRNTWTITLIKEKTNFINVDPQLPWLKIHPTCALHAEKYLDYITLIKEKTNFINVDPQLPWLKIHATCTLHAEKYLEYHIDQREDELHQCRSAATMAKDSPYLRFACGEIPGLYHIDQREDELHQCRSAATMAKDSRHLHFACGEIPGISH